MRQGQVSVRVTFRYWHATSVAEYQVYTGSDDFMCDYYVYKYKMEGG